MENQLARQWAIICEGQWKLRLPMRMKDGEIVPYDILADAAESNNLAAKHPDIVKKLSAKLEVWTSMLPKEDLKTDDKQD